jgi:hypothetical protein
MVNLKPCLSFSNMHVYVYLNYLLYVLFVQQLIASLLFLQISNKMFIKLHLTIKILHYFDFHWHICHAF